MYPHICLWGYTFATVCECVCARMSLRMRVCVRASVCISVITIIFWKFISYNVISGFTFVSFLLRWQDAKGLSIAYLSLGMIFIIHFLKNIHPPIFPCDIELSFVMLQSIPIKEATTLPEFLRLTVSYLPLVDLQWWRRIHWLPGFINSS